MRFRNPPIVEAVIGFTIPELPESVIADFRSASGDLDELGFAEIGSRFHRNFSFSVQDGSTETSAVEMGVQFRNKEKPVFIAQFLRNGFFYSQTGKYTCWEEFTCDAKRLWSAYLKITGITEVQTYQVRYINRLNIPEGEEWSDYVNIYPHIPANIPQAITEYFSRIVMPLEGPVGSRLVHTQAIVPADATNPISFLLDNDFQFSANGISLSGLWKKVDDVREVKDHYFDAFTTQKMKELFDA